MQQTLVNSVLIWYDLFTKFLPVGNKILGGKIWSGRPESKTLWNSTPLLFFLHNSQIVISFVFFFSHVFGFAEVIYIAVVITLTTHSFVRKLGSVRPGDSGIFSVLESRRRVRPPLSLARTRRKRLPPLRPAVWVTEPLHFGSSSRESVRGSIVAAGPRSGCFKRFIVFFKACLLLQNQTRTTSLS